jgi:uncharacterized membrane protein
MITSGDKVCHWAVRRKAQAKGLDDPLKVLKMRLAKGEMSGEEYKRLKRLIEE